MTVQEWVAALPDTGAVAEDDLEDENEDTDAGEADLVLGAEAGFNGGQGPSSRCIFLI